MSMNKIFLFLFLAGIGFIVYLYFYLGFTKDVQIEVAARGPLLLLSSPHTGAYHQIGPAITKVEAWAKDNNVHCPKSFAEFLDDPDAMDQDRLRSRGGCLLTSAPTNNTPADFHFEEREKKKYVVARFLGAPSIGPFKVYPRVREFIQERRLKRSGPVIETYTVDGPNVTTEFLFPIAD